LFANNAKKIDQLINGQWILPIEPTKTLLKNHSIAVDQDTIIEILPTEQAQQYYEAKTIIHRPNHIILPGLVNAHTHLAMNLLRSYADDLPLFEWLQNHMWPAEAKIMNEDAVRAGTALALAEMIRGGSTCFNDMYFFPLQLEEIAIKYGVRGSVGQMVMNVKNNWASDEEDYLKKAEQCYAKRTQHPLISWAMTPHAPYTNSDDSLLRAKALADQWRQKINIHLHETQMEVEQHIQQHGMRPLQRLDKLGLLSDQCIAVHMVHLTADDIELVKARNVHIVHCPESALKLGSGIAPIPELVAKGVNVAIGTDSAASNNDLDMFSEMRTAALIAKGSHQNPALLPAEQVLTMATLNGAKALGLDDKIGSLLPGKQADMIAVNLDHPFTQPIYHPVSLLVYAVNCMQVSDVWIAGRQLLEKGNFTCLDYAEILADSQIWFERCKK